MITDFEKREERWGKAGWVIRQSWKYDGKPVKLVVYAKNGKRYVPEKPPDDPLVGYLMSDFGMKISAARLLARRVPKGTEAERILAVHRMYDREVAP